MQVLGEIVLRDYHAACNGGIIMNRLEEPNPDALTAEQSEILQRLVAGRGRILGPYKIWIHSPAVASAMEQLGTFLNKRSSLNTREVELCILLIACHWDADYVLQAHLREARKAGLSDEVINATVAGQSPKLTDAHASSVFRFASALVRGARLSDVEFSEVEKEIGRQGIAEVLTLLGYYTAVALGMKVHEVPPSF